MRVEGAETVGGVRGGRGWRWGIGPQLGLDLVVRPVAWNHFWVIASFENSMDAKERMHTHPNACIHKHTQTHTHTVPQICVQRQVSESLGTSDKDSGLKTSV